MRRNIFMKKLLAVILAAMMLLGCVSALAD
jgi:hypothetical protein